MRATQSDEWKKTACTLCAVNCGLGVQSEGRRIDPADGSVVHRGVALNELTDIANRDPIAGTPWHKRVAARIERVGVAVEVAG